MFGIQPHLKQKACSCVQQWERSLNRSLFLLETPERKLKRTITHVLHYSKSKKNIYIIKVLNSASHGLLLHALPNAVRVSLLPNPEWSWKRKDKQIMCQKLSLDNVVCFQTSQAFKEGNTNEGRVDNFYVGSRQGWGLIVAPCNERFLSCKLVIWRLERLCHSWTSRIIMERSLWSIHP